MKILLPALIAILIYFNNTRVYTRFTYPTFCTLELQTDKTFEFEMQAHGVWQYTTRGTYFIQKDTLNLEVLQFENIFKTIDTCYLEQYLYFDTTLIPVFKQPEDSVLRAFLDEVMANGPPFRLVEKNSLP